MKNYDIENITDMNHTHTVELTFQQGENKVKIVEEVGGNCTGMDMIDCAITNAADNWPHQNEDGDSYFPQGKDLGDRYEDGVWMDEDDMDDELKNRLVSAKITKVSKKAIKP